MKEVGIILWLVADQLLSFNIFLIWVTVGQTNTAFKGFPSVLTDCWVVSWTEALQCEVWSRKHAFILKNSAMLVQLAVLEGGKFSKPGIWITLFIVSVLLQLHTSGGLVLDSADLLIAVQIIMENGEIWYCGSAEAGVLTLGRSGSGGCRWRCKYTASHLQKGSLGLSPSKIIPGHRMAYYRGVLKELFLGQKIKFSGWLVAESHRQSATV